MKNINENGKTSKSQNALIIEWMLAGNTITQLEALSMYGCSRLAARIADIRAKGYLVYSEFITTPSGKRIKQYYL